MTLVRATFRDGDQWSSRVVPWVTEAVLDEVRSFAGLTTERMHCRLREDSATVLVDESRLITVTITSVID